MFEYHAKLVQHPYPDELIPGTIQQSPQLTTEDDFRAYRALSKESWVPILVSFSQKYRFMDKVMELVDRNLDDFYDTLIMTCRVPGTMRFPDRFNADKVFLVADIAAETDRLLQRGARFAVIEEGIVRHPMENGKNELILRLHSDLANAGQAFAKCEQELTDLGLEPVADRVAA